VVLVVDYEGVDDLVGDYTENLTTGGTFVHTEREFAIGTPVRLLLSFPGLLEPLRLSGVVRWTRSGGGVERGVGIEFTDFDEGARERLEQVVSSIGKRDPSYVGQVLKILVVEDNPHVAGLIRDGLAHTGSALGAGVTFDFQVCADGRAALDAVERDQFDAFIVDIYLPVLDGSHVIARLREDERTRAAPVIAVSAGGAAAREIAMQAGADFFLDKPMRLRQIIDTMRKLIRLER
jgi:uncharacterized protein (TIGR02266 family)